MTLHQTYLLVSFFILSTTLCSQGEANNWYFGQNAGVNFNTNPPSALNNGVLTTTEGCSSISDASGNLLFYSDGRTVWNRNHQIMPNANYFAGNGLFGDPSSTSSALIVPKPGDPNLYYIFTVDEPHHNNANAYPNTGPANSDGTPTDGNLYPDSFAGVPEADDGFNNGFNYSAVDMRLAGGFGDVVATEKNIPLLTYDPANTEQIKYKCSEKITAVRADDCDSFWVLSHFIDSFYAFRIDATGVDTTPVVSTVGPTAPIDSYRRSALGYLKASPDGKKLVIAHNTFSFDGIDINSEGPGGIYLHNFNDISGVVSSSIELIDSVNPYGVEFSSETKKVYASVRTGTPQNRTSSILQWDLENTDIPSSMVSIAQNTLQTSFIGALQLASNNKIYVSSFGNPYLAVINQPEADGLAADYSESSGNGAIDLGERTATLGLPPFIQSIFSKAIGIIDDQDIALSSLALCEGDTYRLKYNDIPSASYTWSKDKTTLPNKDYFLDINTTGAYQLEVDLNDGSCPLRGIANVTIAPLPEITSSTLLQCSFSGITENSFDLSKAIPDLTKNKEGLDVQFYQTQLNAEIDQNALNTLVYTTQNTLERLYAKVIDKRTKCSSISTLDLQVNTTRINNVILESCDDAGADGIADFDIANAQEQILQGVPVTNLSLSYHRNVQDALLGKNLLSSTQVTNANPITNAFYARAEDVNNGCYGISEIKLLVNAAPVLEESISAIYCIDGDNPALLNAGQLEEPIDNFTFYWLPSGENTYEINTRETTTHTVTVTNKITGCSSSRTLTIIRSEAPQISNVTIEGYSRNTKSTIIAVGTGNYEYAVDDPNGSYQDSPIFENLDIGNHMAYVRDKNGCGDAIPREFPVLGFPEFFSPNNDGQNDFWKVVGFQEIDQEQASISIFDRYGKLLKTISATSKGWDGTYNGQPLPQSDYWARVELSSGIVLNSHFSLLR